VLCGALAVTGFSFVRVFPATCGEFGLPVIFRGSSLEGYCLPRAGNWLTRSTTELRGELAYQIYHGIMWGIGLPDLPRNDVGHVDMTTFTNFVACLHLLIPFVHDLRHIYQNIDYFRASRA